MLQNCQIFYYLDLALVNMESRDGRWPPEPLNFLPPPLHLPWATPLAWVIAHAVVLQIPRKLLQNDPTLSTSWHMMTHWWLLAEWAQYHAFRVTTLKSVCPKLAVLSLREDYRQIPILVTHKSYRSGPPRLLLDESTILGDAKER